MSTDEKYNGWTNRETWAVALHINNDQGWQESVHEALRVDRGMDQCPACEGHGMVGITDEFCSRCDGEGEVPHRLTAHEAGDIIRESVEEWLDVEEYVSADAMGLYAMHIYPVREDIGSLYRVNWTELGASFLDDISEEGADND